MRLRLPALMIAALLSGLAHSADTVLHTLTGSGGRTSRPFTVADQWELQWEAKGDLFQIFVYDDAGRLIGVAANQLLAGTGASFMPKGGRYYIQINSMGTWTVRVVQIDPHGSVKK